MMATVSSECWRHGLIETRHVRQRCAQRNIEAWQVDLVLQYGRRIRASAAQHIFFGRREASLYEKALGRSAEVIEGLVVVVQDDGVILTAYRNHEAPRHLRRRKRRQCY